MVSGVSYLLEVVSGVQDVLLLAAQQGVDQLLDHTGLLMDDGQVQRTVGKVKSSLKTENCQQRLRSKMQ